MAHYVALNPIVCLLVASINRPLSGCLNQNDSNTGSIMMPSQRSTLNTEHSQREKESRGEARGEEKEEKRKPCERVTKGEIVTREFFFFLTERKDPGHQIS